MTELRVFREPTDAVQNEIFEIQHEIFTDFFSREKIAGRLARERGFLSLHAYDNGKLVGFKTGFRLGEGIFYSWIGGVLPSHREAGLARQLMDRQHEILRSEGYSRVQTKTENKYRAMLIFNIKAGFDITGTDLIDEGRRLQVLLEKKL